jgi:hypothetical protein
MEQCPQWIYHDSREKSHKKIKVMSWKGKGSMKEGFEQIQSATGQRRYRTAQVDRRYNPVHHSVIDFLWGGDRAAGRPSPSDHANHLGDSTWEETELKSGRGTQPSIPTSRRDNQEGIRPSYERIERSSRSQGEEKKSLKMASSSGSKPSTEERLNAMDVALENLKQMLNYQLDFLQNLDIDAGRRLETLEGDITTTKFEITEELDKLHKELKDPKKEFETRITQLEEKMAQLNNEWKRDPEK